jgi:hypothetical protein
MSTVRLLSDHFIQLLARYLQWKHYFLLKLTGFIIIILSLLTLINRHHHSPSFLVSQRDHHHVSLSPAFIQSLLITKINLTESVLPPTTPPANYLDPFIYSRIQFTHSDDQRSETSRKWCQGQSKYIRPQDLEPYKCANIQQFDNTEHIFCHDPFTRNSCLVLSFGIGQNQLEDSFNNQLYDWGGCRLLTFDPYQQPIQSNTSNIMLTIKPNWIFYRLGLTASAAVDDNSNLMTMRKLMEYININSRIDILRIDIDNANEWNLLDDSDFFLYLCRNVKQLIVKTKPIYSKRFQHYRIFTLKLNKCFALLRRRSRLYLLGRHNQFESEWSLTTFALNLGLFCDEIDMSMYLLVYGHLYLVNTKL